MNNIFTQAISEICRHSSVAPDRQLRCMVVVNPVAGGFLIKSRWRSHLRTLAKYQKKAELKPVRSFYKNITINVTEGKGSAREITKSFLERKIEKDANPFDLIISAGGDGTHSEIMSSIHNAPTHIRSNLALIRLPMGTGNDCADSTTLAGALDILLNSSHVEYASAVELLLNDDGPTKWKGPFLAYNILSVGLDAYVTHQTNIQKGKMIGDSYKFWIDIAALSYDKKFNVDYIDVKAYDFTDNEVASFNEKLLLLAMGVSGNRTYGSHQKILPDYRNVCGINQISLLKKLALKGQVSKGKHAKNPNVHIFNAHRVEFTGSQPILAQMDGETVLLQPKDFPAKMVLTQPVIPLLKIDQNTY